MSVGLLGSREQASLQKCSPSALESALGSAPESALEGAPPVVVDRESTLESTLRSTPESTPISESTLESTFGDLPVLGSLAGRQTHKVCELQISWRMSCDPRNPLEGPEQRKYTSDRKVANHPAAQGVRQKEFGKN